MLSDLDQTYMTNAASTGNAYGISEIQNAMDAMRKLMPATPEKSYVMHPAFVGRFNKVTIGDRDIAVDTLCGMKVTIGANAESWVSPKSPSPHFTYGPEDEAWAKPLGLGKMEPAIYECTRPRMTDMMARFEAHIDRMVLAHIWR